MEYKLQVTSINSQAVNWVLMGLKRNSQTDILKACEDTAIELKMTFEEIEGKLTFRDQEKLQWMKKKIIWKNMN